MQNMLIRTNTLFRTSLLMLSVASMTDLSSTTATAAEETPATHEMQSHMVPMRDGVSLYTEVYRPLETKGPMPILFLRTPYGVSGKDGAPSRMMRTTFRELGQDNYLIVLQDCRGRHLSEGTFVWNRPVQHLTDPHAIDECTDAHDSIEWMINHLEGNNGKVGILGVSYPGWLAAMALVNPHPALAAGSPQASPSDYFIGDDFYHFGAFRLCPSTEYPYMVEHDAKKNSRFPYDVVDTYEFFLKLGPLSRMNEVYLQDSCPTWKEFLAHSTYDEFWERGATLPNLTRVSIPVLHVVGWWDAENFGGSMDLYDHLEQLDTQSLNSVVIGPWAHGQWARGPDEHLGKYPFGSNTREFYQREVERVFFSRHLQGREPETPSPLTEGEALIFQTGSNVWKSYETWPPRSGDTIQDLYLHADRSLSFSAPPDHQPVDSVSYISDPAHPVPYAPRPIMGFWQGLPGSEDPRFGRAGILYKVEDQRFVDGRPDVVSFVTSPLAEDLEVAGPLEVKLFASTTGTDADWVVKLIDVYPDDYPEKPEMGGYQLMVYDEVLRGKFREGFANPQPLQPGQREEFTINLRSRSHCFRKGHRVMLQVQSSWFPLIDRNPQKFINIPDATADDYQAAEHRIDCSAAFPSRIRLPVVHRPVTDKAEH